MRASLRYRALDESRQALRLKGPLMTKLKAASYSVLFPSAAIVAHQIHRHLLTISEAASPVVVPGMILIGTLSYFIIASELFKEISFAPDLALLRISPVSDAEVLGSRLFFVGTRLLPLYLALMVFPISIVLCPPVPGTSPGVLFVWAVAFLAWVQMLSLRTAVGLAEMSSRRRIPPELMSAAILAVGVTSGAAAGFVLMDPAGWKWWQHLLWWAGNSDPALCVSGAAFLGLSAWFYRGSLRHWPATCVLPEAGRITDGSFPSEAARFGHNPAFALLQKDKKDLMRNPAYRIAFVACFVLLPLALLVQWRAGSQAGPSERRMMTSLALLYLVPLFVSARTVSMERSMMGFYRLVLPDVAKLLDWKWRVQAVANCLITSVLSLPVFVLVRGGGDPHESLHYAAAVVVCVPLLTMLAMALGAFFPASSIVSSPIGIRLPGLAAFVAPAVVLYSLLLSRLYIATAVYLLVLAPLTLALFARARRRLRRL